MDIDCFPPTGEEVIHAIRSLKYGKVPGVDFIAIEMLKSDVASAANALTPLLKRMWQDEELPDD